MLDACIALLPHNEKTARVKVPGFERQSILGHKVKGVAVVMPEPRTQGIVALLAEPGQVHQAQDVGALERRPVETPPLRVEDVVGHGTGAGGIICIVGGRVGGVGGLCVGGVSGLCVGGVSGSVGGVCVCVGGGLCVGPPRSSTSQPAPRAQDRRRAAVICCLACVTHRHVDGGRAGACSARAIMELTGNRAAAGLPRW